jgi:hypothetical protein
MWMLRVSPRVSSIALFKPGHRFGGRYDRLVGMGWIGGAGKLVAAKYTSRENEECKVCLCHNVLCFIYVYLLFLIEIKAVQNAMGKRCYDQGCYADKSQSGKQSVTGSKYFGRRRMESIHRPHSAQNH